MKKWTALLLVLVMCLALCACRGGNNQQTSNHEATASNSGIWSLSQTVDEFGDVTAGSQLIVVSSTSGDFSNSATNSSKLLVETAVFISYDGLSHKIGFHLSEYGDSPATFLPGEADNLLLKMKIDGQIYDGQLFGDESDYSYYLGTVDDSAVTLFNALKNGNDVPCIINIGNSQYNFTLASSNFSDICEQTDAYIASMVPEGLTEAIETFLDDDEPHMVDAMKTLTDSVNSFEQTSISDLAGSYFEISVDTFAPYWYIYKYENNTRGYTAKFDYNKGNYRPIWIPGAFVTNDIIVNDDGSYYPKNISSHQYQLRMITDDILIEYEADDSGAFTIPNKLMFRYDEPVASIEDAYDVMLPYIRETLVPEIP